MLGTEPGVWQARGEAAGPRISGAARRASCGVGAPGCGSWFRLGVPLACWRGTIEEGGERRGEERRAVRGRSAAFPPSLPAGGPRASPKMSAAGGGLAWPQRSLSPASFGRGTWLTGQNARSDRTLPLPCRMLAVERDASVRGVRDGCSLVLRHHVRNQRRRGTVVLRVRAVSAGRPGWAAGRALGLTLEGRIELGGIFFLPGRRYPAV